MSKILLDLNKTLIAGGVLLVLFVLVNTVLGDITGEGADVWRFVFRLIHVASAVMWIGLLWYFNFVQTPSMPKIPDEQKPAISKVIAPSALFWFRWAALFTWVTGLVLATLNGYLLEAIALGITSGIVGHTVIGVGMWLGTIMAFNVWFIIWPSQRVALGIISPQDDAHKKRAAKTATLYSRVNTMLSIPMLYAMVSAQSLYSLS